MRDAFLVYFVKKAGLHMFTNIKNKSVAWLGTISFMVNYFPYVIYILLINRSGSLINDVLPMAIFYAFRRTALFIFRDLRKNSILLGWIALMFGLLGSITGIFGVISHFFFDLSAVFVGSAAAIFPASLNQNKRKIALSKKKGSSKKALIGLFIILLLLAIFAVIAKFAPTIAFLWLLIANTIGMIGYYRAYGFYHQKGELKISWPNLVLVAFLFAAMLLMEAGRNKNVGTFVEWGILLLAIFLVVLMLILIFDHHAHFSAASKETYFQMSMYGVCAMFWITYSGVLVTIVHGAGAFAWIFFAYIAAVALGKPLASFVTKVSPIDVLTTDSLVIILGVLCTFWFPTFFVGAFLIRAFANYQKEIALNKYEKETNNQADSYYLQYYLTSLSAFWTQTIMWLTLIICCHPLGFDRVLHAITFHEIATNYLSAIQTTHVVLALVMITFVILTYFVSKKSIPSVN